MEKRQAEPGALLEYLLCNTIFITMASGISEERKKELQVIHSLADAYTAEELHQKFQEFEIKSPDTGNAL